MFVLANHTHMCLTRSDLWPWDTATNALAKTIARALAVLVITYADDFLFDGLNISGLSI